MGEPSWLTGRLALVTGASRGIGAATAAALAGAGAEVVLAARDGDALEAIAEGIRARGGAARAQVADVAEPGQVERLFAAVQAEGPPLSALVCAAGVLTPAPFAHTSTEVWERTLAVNLTGAFLCCRAAFRSMSGGGGRIVNIASLSGVYATEKFPGLAAYNVSKYGVVGLTEAIAVEGRDLGISAICISPGAVDTDMLRRANPSLRPGLTPDDVGRLIVALLESPMEATSGANIPLFSNA